MNCQDIAQILDNADISQQSGSARAGVAAHLAACADCSRDWELQLRLHALPDLDPPAGLAGRMRAAVAASTPRRAPSRRIGPVVAGGAIALAAAASIFTLQQRAPDAARPGVEQADAPAKPLEPAAVPPPIAPHQAPVDPPPVATGGAVLPQQVEAVEVTRVAVLPVTTGAQDAAGRAEADAFHAALLAQLGQLPGVAVQSIEAREDLDDTIPYLLEVKVDPAAEGLRVVIRAARRGSNPLVLPLAGEFNAGCSNCFDAAGLATAMVNQLRTVVLPEPPSSREESLVQLADATASPEVRIQALRRLAAWRMGPPGEARRLERGAALADPDAIDGALALARAEPRHRAEIWRTLLGTPQPALLEPLVDTALRDPDPAVRAEAVASLGAGFGDHDEVRLALEQVVRQENDHLVRALAQRIVVGESSWRMYVGTTLRDTSLPVEQRLAALTRHLDAEGGTLPAGRLLDGVLEAGDGPMLADLLAAARQSAAARPALPILLSRLGAIDHPAVNGYLPGRPPQQQQADGP